MQITEENREQLIPALSHRFRHITEGMIKVNKPATFTRVGSICSPSTRRTGTFGGLEQLPLEVLHMVLAMLDFQSLSRLLRTCRRAVQVVEYAPEYHALMTHAPEAVAALGYTRLAPHHSAAQLHGALLDAECVSCGRFAPFLFLPTCSRICPGCLGRDKDYWVTTINFAMKAFGLSRGEVASLTVMRGMPGRYCICSAIKIHRHCRLVSVGAARRLAASMSRQGEVGGRFDDRRATEVKEKDFCYVSWLRRPSRQTPGRDMPFRSIEAAESNDRFCGMASIPFPHLSANRCIEKGLWCLGCELLFQSFRGGWDQQLNAMQHLVWSREGFWEHIQTCKGAEQLALKLRHPDD